MYLIVVAVPVGPIQPCFTSRNTMEGMIILHFADLPSMVVSGSPKRWYLGTI